jgi:hypothetical protein
VGLNGLRNPQIRGEAKAMNTYIYTKYEKGKDPEKLLIVFAESLLEADKIFEKELGFNPAKKSDITVRNPNWPCFAEEKQNAKPTDPV